MTDELNGYSVGQRVEARDEGQGDPWKSGVIERLDADDSSYPYEVLFEGDEYGTWVRPQDIRALSAVPATRLEFRRVSGSGFTRVESPWSPFELGEDVSATKIAVPPSSYASAVEFRRVPARTADEILAKLNEHLIGRPGALSSSAKEILGGKF